MYKALNCGMIRPFLLLITMTPLQRIRVAGMLGMVLVTEKYFNSSNVLYPHRDAWKIIHCHLLGMQARTNRTYETLNPFSNNCNWYECIRRATRVNFKVLLQMDIIFTSFA